MTGNLSCRSALAALVGLAVIFVVLGSPSDAARAHDGERVTLDPPVRVTLRPDGGDRVDGQILDFGERSLTLELRDGELRDIDWHAIRSARVYWIFERILDRDDADGWFELAVRLYPRDDGKADGEKAIRRALALDPAFEELAERLRAGEAVQFPVVESEVQIDDRGEADSEPPNREPSNGDQPPAPPAVDGEDAPQGPGIAAGPQNVGELQAQFWGDLSPELMAASVAELKAEAEAAQQKSGLQLRLYEDPIFLVYTDLPEAEASRWVGLLDDMYARLIETFSLEKGKNIFRGKLLIYLVQSEMDYIRLCAATLGFNASGTAGVCQSRGNGYAVVIFYRQPNTLNFAHVLVHESVHAFVHRYRSHPHIPSWINEGLAEHIAHRLVSQRGFGKSDFARTVHYGRQYLRHYGSMGGMLDAPSISAWMYPVAGELCSFMIDQSPRRYKAFIDGLKDGKSWRQALAEDYGLSPEQLVEAFGDSVHVRNLRP